MTKVLKPLKTYHYIYSCDLEINLQVQIGSLEGYSPTGSGIDDRLSQDMYVTCQLFDEGHDITLVKQSAYKAFEGGRLNWNEWLSLPTKFSDLPRTASMLFTVWNVADSGDVHPVGEASIDVFSSHGTIQTGMFDLKLALKSDEDPTDSISEPDETKVKHLQTMRKKYSEGGLPRVDWLDRLTFREMEHIVERHKRRSHSLYLLVEFPRLANAEDTVYDVVYYEKGGDQQFLHYPDREVVLFPDPDIMQVNLVESKHHMLARNLHSGTSDKDLKPDPTTRNILQRLVSAPCTKQLTSEEQDLVWRFRYHLSAQPRALPKFLRCVAWSEPEEKRQALELMWEWSPPDPGDALELLSPSFTEGEVRRYAVSRLQTAEDESVLLYLLQLVQAMRYEVEDTTISNATSSPVPSSVIALNDATSSTVLSGAVGESSRSTAPHQHDSNLVPVAEDGLLNFASAVASTAASAVASTAASLSAAIAPGKENSGDKQSDSSSSSSSHGDQDGEDSGGTEAVGDGQRGDTSRGSRGAQHFQKMDLATFLIRRACNNNKIATGLFWYLRVECDDMAAGGAPDEVVKSSRFHRLCDRLMRTLAASNPKFEQQISDQRAFVEKIRLLITTVTRESGNRKRKIEKLKELLAEPEEGGKKTSDLDLSSFPPLPLPLDPTKSIIGIESKDAYLYKSALCPARLSLKTEDGGHYSVMFKHGDDLRQDQLVLQMVALMDGLLQRENLDLHLTPYKVIATSSKHGFMEFVDAKPIAEVLGTEDSIVSFLRKHAPGDGHMGIDKSVMDTYIRSCAGYCVITYILGVGDRHLDNLMLTKAGHLVHIDFGFILGRDPKPLPPPMKLTREMVDAMGGAGSEHFKTFSELCFTTFLHLRRSANLILNLFSLLVNANIPDIVLEPDKTVKKVEDKFMLHLSDEEAAKEMQGLIEASVYSLMPTIVENFHRFAQYWRK